jgi:hypothetical protein
MTETRPTAYAVQKIIERAVKAAKDAGYRVTDSYAFPDGTVRVDVERDKPARYVYFIQMEKAWHVKVGVAKHVGERHATLQTSNPEKLEILAAFPGTEHDEAQIHAALSHYRLRGEWFTFGPWVKILERSKGDGLASVIRRLKAHRP